MHVSKCDHHHTSAKIGSKKIADCSDYGQACKIRPNPDFHADLQCCLQLPTCGIAYCPKAGAALCFPSILFYYRTRQCPLPPAVPSLPVAAPSTADPDLSLLVLTTSPL